MSSCNDIDKVLKRGGTDQGQRFIDALNPANLELNDLDTEDWILFAYNFAKHVNYFNIADDITPSGNWQDLFNHFNIQGNTIPFRTSNEYQKLKKGITNILSQYETEGKLTPHLTLFVSFLHLLELSKKRFNTLTKKHLDFYYKDILHLQKLKAVPDQVHVIFELAKKSTEERIVGHTQLNAKKDVNGNQMIYKTNEELIVNKTAVASLKSIYNDLILSELKASSKANTLDGLEEPLPKDEPYWFPFGYTSVEENFTELPDAEIGFALASPIFNLQEGLRTIEVTIEFEVETEKEENHNLIDFSVDTIKDIMKIYGSGKEDWIGPLPLKTTTDATNDMASQVESNNKLILAFQLNKDVAALVGYDQKLLVEKYHTTLPVIRFLIDTQKTGDASKGHDFYRALVRRKVIEIIIKTDVKDAKTLIIENDFGSLNVKKPFYPFTTQPIKGSNFYIDYPEAFSKNWTSLNVNLKWKNTPDDFKKWYEAYLKNFQIGTIKKTYVSAIVPADIGANVPIVSGASYFVAEKAMLHKEEWDELTELQTLFTEIINSDPEDESVQFESNIVMSNSSVYAANGSGPIRLTLAQSFLHELFPRLYALAITSDEGIIPNEPYTPLIEEISIAYKAEEHIEISSQTLPIDENDLLTESEKYRNDKIKLFHIHPFGQREIHNYLSIIKREKGIIDKYDSATVHSTLVPEFCHGGELLIGLKDASVLQTVALLVQVWEGSENPEVESFGDNENIDWSILCENRWKDLTEHIVSNNTNNFLSSGIIKFTIPSQATDTNTLLPENYFWIRARMHKAYSAVCKVIDINAQAVLSTFYDNGNELSHLEHGLVPKTIEKMITRIPQIKSISQPYNSFNGIPEETDSAFYRRISERLRHKNRAITLWDYEHLILQQFPDIFKVKCLNHTKPKSHDPNSKDNFVSAGNVTLVVIPDTVNKNVFDIFKPRVSQGSINKIKSYVNSLNTLHVSANVVNPDYEEVTISLEVKFHKGFDESFYSSQLNEDIIKFLSPWAFDDSKKIDFGISLHRSILIDYLEKLKYVDYLKIVTIEKDGDIVANSILPSSPKAILVSAKEHKISPMSKHCKDLNIQEPTGCLV